MYFYFDDIDHHIWWAIFHFYGEQYH